MKFKVSVLVMLGLIAVLTFNLAPAQDDNAVQVTVEKAMRDASWRITTAWDNGVNGTFDITFRNDGTLIAGGGIRGRWFQIDRKYVWAFNGVGGVPDWSITYAGDVASNGTTLRGIEGWVHTSGRPKGVHSGVRSFKLIADASRLTETSPGIALGQEKK